MTFKPGDKVRCINGFNQGPLIVKSFHPINGNVYTVAFRRLDGLLELEEISEPWSADRFEYVDDEQSYQEPPKETSKEMKEDATVPPNHFDLICIDHVNPITLDWEILPNMMNDFLREFDNVYYTTFSLEENNSVDVLFFVDRKSSTPELLSEYNYWILGYVAGWRSKS